jgi:hypothetical protein
MAQFAKLNYSNVVESVIVVSNNESNYDADPATAWVLTTPPS